MRSKAPKNHHYVPQHFLKAWADERGYMFRYRYIPATGAFEIKPVSIRKSASRDHLYRMSFKDGSFEIESTILTPIVDEEGHKILELVRHRAFRDVRTEDKRLLANYITRLEARHPDIIEAMDMSDRLEELRVQLKSEKLVRGESIDDVIDYLKSSDTLGLLPLALFLQNESKPMFGKPFSDSLMNAYTREYTFSEPVLLCSDYPVARWGDYSKSVFCVLALSPTKAVIYSSSANIEVFDQVSANIRADIINLYTISKSEAAYFIDDSKCDFVKQHLGWAKRHQDLNAQKDYIGRYVSEWTSTRGTV